MTRHALFWVLLALFISSAFEGCGGIKSKDSESHFLEPCTSTCAPGLECLCGVCTRSCNETSECTALDPQAACVVPAESGLCRAAAPKICNVDTSTSSVPDGQAGGGGSGGRPGDAAASGGSGGKPGDASATGGSGGAASDASASGGSGGGPDAGDDGPVPCVLDDAWFAMKIEMTVLYGGQTGMWAANFTGTVRLLTLVHLAKSSSPDGGVYLMVPMDLRVCGLQVPDFTVPDPMVAPLGKNSSLYQLNTMEVYGITFPNAVWDNWTADPTYAMKETLAVDRVPSRNYLLPGDTLWLSELALPMGAWSSGPISVLDWPNNAGTDYAKFINGSFDPWEQVDMDQDGHPGITGVAKTGAIPADSAVYTAQGDPTAVSMTKAVTTYSLPLGDTTSNQDRASEIYLALRAITDQTHVYATRLTSCDRFDGGAPSAYFDHRVVGCLQAEGPGAPRDCGASLTTATFDSWVPQLTAWGGAGFIAKRLTNPPATLMSPGACTPAREAFATDFAP